MRSPLALLCLATVWTVVSSACTDNSPQTAAPTEPASTATQNCPLTRPDVGPPPDAIDSNVRPVPWVKPDEGWYGNDALWVSLPPESTLQVSRDDDGFTVKFPWWRLDAGQLSAHATPVGGGEQVEASVPNGYGDRGFTPSALRFDSEGCWRITGTVGGQDMSFVVRVCENDDSDFLDEPPSSCLGSER